MKTVIKMLCVMMIVASVPVNAAPMIEKGEGRYEAKQHMIEEIIGELGLSETQMKQIKDRRAAAHAEKQQDIERLRDKKTELKDALAAESVDRAEIDRLIAEISEIKTEKLRHWVDSLLAIREILSPEQYARFREKLDARKSAEKESA